MWGAKVGNLPFMLMILIVILTLVCGEARSREQEHDQDSGRDAGDYGFDFKLTPGAVCL